MSDHQFKLFYFGLRGRGEAIRYLFALAEVPYEDIIVTFEEWPAMKESTPFNCLPLLQIDDDLKLSQHLAICRYLAKKFGFAGNDKLESAKVDMFVESAEEMLKKFTPVVRKLRNGDPDAAAEIAEEVYRKDGVSWLTHCQKNLELNPAGWLVGQNLTWADLYVAEAVDKLQNFYSHALDEFPAMKDYKEKVFSIPEIAKRIADRPEDWVF